MPEMDRSLPLEVSKINDWTYSIEDNGVRCLLFIGSGSALLVDTGFGEAGSLKAVVDSLTNKPVTLVNTHADHDHIGNNAEFDIAYMHPSEMAYYSQNAKPGASAGPLWEGDAIDLGGLRFEVVLIPGHTPGSIALLDRENRIIVTGDSVSERPVFMLGAGSDFQAYFASMEKLSAMAGSFDWIYPSHGQLPLPPGQIGKEIAAAEKLLAGELQPMEPPFPLPAKMYMHDGAGFLC